MSGSSKSSSPQKSGKSVNDKRKENVEKVKEEDLKKRNEVTEKTLILISVLIFFVAGFGIWWKTTEVYRATYPFDEIISIASSNRNHFGHTLAFQLIFLEENNNKYEANVCSEDISQEFLLIEQHFTIPTKFEISCFQETISSFDSFVSQNDFAGLETSLENFHLSQWIKSSGKYNIYIKPSSSRNKQEVIFGKNRNLFFLTQEFSSESLVRLLKQYFVVESNLLLPYDYFRDIPSYSSFVNFAEQNELRRFPANFGYQLSFTLLNGNPYLNNVTWDIQQAIQKYIQPFEKEMKQISTFDIESQIQYFAEISATPEQSSKGYSYFTSDSLSRFVNKSKWNLASSISSFPQINFLFYIPSPEIQPLHIHDSEDKILETNAFLIPRYGGVIIENLGETKTTHSLHLSAEDLQPAMETFLSQLRSLVGINSLDQTFSFIEESEENIQIKFLPSPSTGLTHWEMDSLIRRNIYHNIQETISTLISLSRLLYRIQNIVVEDDIRDQVLESIHSLQTTITCLTKANYLEALSNSKRSLELAEKSFFDPSMLSRLYFPDDYKYAVYVPLFLPISFPVLLALFAEFKRLRLKKSSSQ